MGTQWYKVTKTDAWMQAIQQVIDHEIPIVDRDLINQLGHLGESAEAAAPMLIEMSSHKDPWMRSDAVGTLARIGRSAEAAIPALIELLGDESTWPLVRGNVAIALSRIGESAVPALIEALNHEKEYVRGGAAWALGMIGAPSAVSTLIEALDDESEWVRGDAVSALKQIGTPEALKAAEEFDKKPQVAARQVWAEKKPDGWTQLDNCGAPSPDGRYLSFTNWDQGNLAVRDLITGENRDLTDAGTWDGLDQWAANSTWSPDGKQMAYAWYNVDHWELRIVGFDGSEPRIIYCNEEKNMPEHPNGVRPFTWSQDGKYILTRFHKKASPNELALEIVLVSVDDGSVRVLRSLKNLAMWHRYQMSLSPDGRYIVYDCSVKEHDDARDIFLLATNSDETEIPLVEHPADNYGPVWTSDGKGIVFVSDRSGDYYLWLMQVVDGKPVGEPQIVKKYIIGGIWGMRPMGFTREGSLYYGLDSDFGGDSTDICIASIDPATGELLVAPTKAVQRFEGHNYSPAWSPDGKSLAYVSLRPLQGSSTGRRDVLVIRSEETGEERELYPEVQLQRLLWSPDGRFIICRWSHHHLIDVQTGDVTEMLQPAPTGNVNFGAIAWSPDGKTIFCVRPTQEGHSLIAHDLKTGEEKELSRLPHEVEEVEAASLTDTADCQQIPGLHPTRGLGLLLVGGGKTRRLVLLRPQDKGCFVPGFGPVATPDGRYILFGKKRNEQSRMIELCRIPAEGGEPQKLMEVDETALSTRQISVHPDGQRIAFTSSYRTMMEVWIMENLLTTFAADK